MVRLSYAELAALGVAAAAFGVGLRALRWGIEAGDPRQAIVRRIHQEADPARDVVVLPDEAPDLLDALAPVPAVYGSLALRDLTGFRRVYALASRPAQLAVYEARLGTPARDLGAAARRWDVAGLATVALDLTDQFLPRATVRREGGQFNGPCPRVGAVFRCQSRDDWNYPRTEPHTLDGVSVRCIFGHPQEHSRLVMEFPAVPRARALVGIVGIDDGAFHPTGAAVVNHVRFVPVGGGAPVERDVVAPNVHGATPYRVDLGDRAGALSFSITTANAGARVYCFTATLTE